MGGEGNYRNTGIQGYRNTENINGEIQEFKMKTPRIEKRKGLQCAGFPLLEAFPIRGRGGILLSL